MNVRKAGVITAAVTTLASILAGCPPVPPPNNPPAITSTAVTSVNEGQQYSYDADATDADGNTLVYSLSTAPTWLLINSETGLITGTAPEVDADTGFPVVVEVSDGKDSVTQEFTLDVINVPVVVPVNNPPVITSTPITQINEGQLYDYLVTATDADAGDVLTYSLLEAPAELSINSSTGQMNGIAPEVDFDATTHIKVQVSDGEDAVTQEYDVTVKDLTIPNIITRAADRLIALQHGNGGWDWEVTNATGPIADPPSNITGVTGEVFIDAYQLTNDSKYLDAAKKAGDLIVTQIGALPAERHFNAFNMVFLEDLATASGNSTYSNFVATKMNDLFTKVTYFGSDSENIISTDDTPGLTAAELVAAENVIRGAAPNGIKPWDLYHFVELANDVGNNAYATGVANGIKTYLDGVNNTSDSWEC